MYLFLRDVKLFLRDSINLQVIHIKISVPSSQRSDAKLLMRDSIYTEVPHKYSAPPSEGYQNPSEESHLQVKNKHLLLRDSMFVILGCLFPYALIIERFLIFKEQIKRSLK